MRPGARRELGIRAPAPLENVPPGLARTQEKGLCPTCDCTHDLRVDRDRLLGTTAAAALRRFGGSLVVVHPTDLTRPIAARRSRGSAADSSSPPPNGARLSLPPGADPYRWRPTVNTGQTASRIT